MRGVTPIMGPTRAAIDVAATAELVPDTNCGPPGQDSVLHRRVGDQTQESDRPGTATPGNRPHNSMSSYDRKQIPLVGNTSVAAPALPYGPAHNQAKESFDGDDACSARDHRP